MPARYLSDTEQVRLSSWPVRSPTRTPSRSSRFRPTTFPGWRAFAGEEKRLGVAVQPAAFPGWVGSRTIPQLPSGCPDPPRARDGDRPRRRARVADRYGGGWPGETRRKHPAPGAKPGVRKAELDNWTSCDDMSPTISTCLDCPRNGDGCSLRLRADRPTRRGIAPTSTGYTRCCRRHCAAADSAQRASLPEAQDHENTQIRSVAQPAPAGQRGLWRTAEAAASTASDGQREQLADERVVVVEQVLRAHPTERGA